MTRCGHRHSELRVLGSSNVQVSALGFGGAALGNLYEEVTPEHARACVAEAIASGLIYFDTAPYYGLGLSEERLGSELSERPTGVFTVSTKVGRLLTPVLIPGETARRQYGFNVSTPLEVTFDYTYDGIMRSFDSSLRRLTLDKVDILLVHDLGEETHGSFHAHYWQQFTQSGYRALQELREQGLVELIGMGVNECDVCLQAMDFAMFDCFLLAGRYTLLEQGALDTLFPACEAHGASILLGGPYNSGILAVGSRAQGQSHYNYGAVPEFIRHRVVEIEQVCERFNVDLKAAALQFVDAHPLIASVIPGMRSPAEVKAAIEAFNQPIPDGFWQVLKEQSLIHPLAPTPAPLDENSGTNPVLTED